jgi:hypothetical protein
MPVPSPLPDTELDAEERDEMLDQPSWWRRWLAAGLRAGARGVSAVRSVASGARNRRRNR